MNPIQSTAMRIFCLLILSMYTFCVSAQNGVITGTATEKDNDNAIAFGAIVRIDSTLLGAMVNIDSTYVISNVPPGTYQVSCQYTGCQKVTIANVVVMAGDTTRVDFSLPELDRVIGEKIFTDDKPPETIFTVDEDIHEGNMTVNGMGQKTIGLLNTTDAGGVGKKIPGITLVDNRFLVIRGLSERYNAVMLNNVLAPSVESDVKAFSFNLIPASMISRFMVYKSPSPEMPGEFAGGVVKITTTEIPLSTVLQCNYQFGYRAGTTFNEFHMNRVGARDWLGLGMSARALPSGFPQNVRSFAFNPAATQTTGQMLPNTWGYETGNALPDQRFNLTWSYRLKDPKKYPAFQFGNVTSFNYSNTNSFWSQRKLDYYAFDPASKSSDTLIDYTDDNYVNSVRIAFVQNNAFRLGRPGKNQHQFTIKNLFNQLGDNETTLRSGSNYEDGEYRNEYSFHYVQRTIYTGQIGGEHTINKERTRIDYTFAYSLGKRNDPDWKRARYSKPFSAVAGDLYTLYVPNSAQPFFLSRLYVAMDEHTVAGTVNAEHDMTFGADSAAKKKGTTITLKAGAYVESKERHFGVRNLGYKGGAPATYGNTLLLTTPVNLVFATPNINNTNGFALDEDTKPSDSYVATNQMMAAYAMVLVPLGKFTGQFDQKKHERIRISMGARMEHNVQQLNSNKQNGDTVVVKNDQLFFLPSVNVALNITDRMLIRGSYGKTVNRPEFREIAPLYFYDFITNSINVGNDSLKTAVIDNVDFRWEFYPNPGELISFAAFYKRFENPIEMYFVPGVGGGGIRSFTWANAPEATSYGMELEVRKEFDSIGIPFVRNLGVAVNAAYIFSRITLTDSYTGPQATTRPMMGQSPWIVNGGLYYQTDSTGWQVNLNYNIIGPRVVVAGVLDVPEIYEMPRHQIDVAIIKTCGRNKNVDVRLNFTDILNQETLLLQDREGDGLNKFNDNRVQISKRGMYVTFGVTVRLFEPKAKPDSPAPAGETR